VTIVRAEKGVDLVVVDGEGDNKDEDEDGDDDDGDDDDGDDVGDVGLLGAT
jgi:hypothetical protein